MANDSIQQAVTSWTKGCDMARARIVAFEKVRDIPYASTANADAQAVLEAKRGSCAGKHQLLAEALRCLGLQVRHMICSHRFNESPIPFPDHMQALLRKNEIVDVHDYLQIAIDGDWVDVDATWEQCLREYGFPVNEDWDGRSPMLLSITVEEPQVADRDPAKIKDEILSHLTPRQRSLRKEFLAALDAWVDEIVAEARRDGQ